ncbi:hypothetical protein CCACVL1_11087, partial [Corchorus capsularis]
PLDSGVLTPPLFNSTSVSSSLQSLLKIERRD